MTASVSTRFLATDGSLAAPDVVVWLASGWSVRDLAADVVADDALLVWRGGAGGIWRTSVSETGLLVPPAPLVADLSAGWPALAAVPDGHLLAWYEGTDTRSCTHNGAGPSRVLLRRLRSDGSVHDSAAPVVLESPLGARTGPRLASGSDASIGALWWRASLAAGDPCTLRFGVADPALSVVADGGVIGPAISGSVVDAEDAYRMAWRRESAAGLPELGFAAFDRGAMLLDAPVVCDLPFESFAGDLGLAAGDHGLVAVVRGGDAATGPRLFFVRTDLLGRTGDASCRASEVDSSCGSDPNCEPGALGVTWAGDAFVVVYFVTLDPGGPSPTTEMRMVRLVPEP